eukprot:gene45875-62128_t
MVLWPVTHYAARTTNPPGDKPMQAPLDASALNVAHKNKIVSAADACRFKPAVDRQHLAGDVAGLVANAVFFLCSDQASYITGQMLAVDG